MCSLSALFFIPYSSHPGFSTCCISAKKKTPLGHYPAGDQVFSPYPCEYVT